MADFKLIDSGAFWKTAEKFGQFHPYYLFLLLESQQIHIIDVSFMYHLREFSTRFRHIFFSYTVYPIILLVLYSLWAS